MYIGLVWGTLYPVCFQNEVCCRWFKYKKKQVQSTTVLLKM